MKVVINKCYGGFGLSPEALLWLHENGYEGEGFKTPVEEYFSDNFVDVLSFKKQLNAWKEYQNGDVKKSIFLTVFSPDYKFVLNGRDIERDNPLLIKCVETLLRKANGECSELSVIEIPDGVEYSIEEYDGMEHIAETHRTWG